MMTIFVVNQRLLLLPVLMVIVGDVLLGIEYIDPTSWFVNPDGSL